MHWFARDIKSKFILSIFTRKIKLIECLISRIHNARELPVKVDSNLPCTLGKKPRTINIEGMPGIDVPLFKPAGTNIIFEVPSSYCNGREV